MTRVFGLGAALVTFVGAMPLLPVNAQAQRIAALDQQSGQHSETFENWMLLAIEGDAEAQFNLGLLYSEGKGVPTDYRQAAFWYLKGAEQGHTGAQYNLAHLYLDGHGVDKDPAQATHWWQQAAQRGHVLAQQYLGYAYHKGIGVSKDQQKALRWFREAAKGGDQRAEKMLATIEQDIEPPSKTGEHQNAPYQSALKDSPRTKPGPPTVSTSKPTEHPGKTTSASAPASADPQSAPGRQAPVAVDPVPQPVTGPARAGDASAEEHQSTVSALQVPAADAAATGKPTTVSPEPGRVLPTPVEQPSMTTAALADNRATMSGEPEPAAANEQIGSGDAPPEREPEITARQPTSPNEIQASVSAASPPPQHAAAGKPLPADAEAVSGRHMQPPLTAKPAASNVKSSTTTPASVTDNDRWLFGQSPDYYTLQLISAPRRATVDAFIRQNHLKNTRLLRTRVNGVWWWYLLLGRYPDRERAVAAAASSTVEQNSVWIRRFGTLQENRCKNLSTAGPSAFCDGERVRVSAGKPRGSQEIGKREAYPSAHSVALNERAVTATPAESPAATGSAPAPTGLTLAEELPASASEQQTAIAGLRHDDNAWLFAQPEGYYTVQLISVPDLSQIARFLHDNKLQDKAIYYTTRREQRNWYFAIYGSHPDLDAAKQATKALSVASGSVWIRQFDAIQKKRCQLENQLPAGASDALHFYCRP